MAQEVLLQQPLQAKATIKSKLSLPPFSEIDDRASKLLPLQPFKHQQHFLRQQLSSSATPLTMVPAEQRQLRASMIPATATALMQLQRCMQHQFQQEHHRSDMRRVRLRGSLQPYAPLQPAP